MCVMLTTCKGWLSSSTMQVPDLNSGLYIQWQVPLSAELLSKFQKKICTVIPPDVIYAKEILV